MLTDIFLIRHGEPARDPAIPYNTPPGPDLSQRGREEARQAAAFLAEKTVEHLFVSPFARTSQTAEEIVGMLPLQVSFTRLVQEHGPGETQEQVRERIREFLAAAEDSPLARIGVVSHGSPVRQLLHELTNNSLDLSKHVYNGGNPAPTCGIWHLRREGQVWRAELVFKPV
ncbi:MAG: histidine phosphatase family protein [Chloroflexaceae bacterium]|nr:histidine phosphatase family protein [Chloroflexaceae bacterium]